MTTTAEFGFTQLFTHVVGEIAKAVSERGGETVQQQFARSQAAMHMIMSFLPRDVIEAMLAGHCVMLHETMTASVHDTLVGEQDAARRATRSNIVALNKEFNSNLGHLERYQARPALGTRDAQEARPAERAAAGPTAAPQAAPKAAPKDTPANVPQAPKPAVETPVPQARSDTPVSVAQAELNWLETHDPDGEMDYHPSPEMLAACQENPEAMAALAAGDPERWAKALGIAAPSAAFLEAARAPGGPFDPNATGPWPAGVLTRRAKT